MGEAVLHALRASGDGGRGAAKHAGVRGRLGAQLLKTLGGAGRLAHLPLAAGPPLDHLRQRFQV